MYVLRLNKQLFIWKYFYFVWGTNWGWRSSWARSIARIETVFVNYELWQKKHFSLKLCHSRCVESKIQCIKLCEYTHNFIHCIFKHFSVEHRAWSNYVEELSIVILPAWLVLNLLLRFRELLLHVVKYSFFWKLLTNLKSRKRERSNSPENITFWGHHPNLFRILLHLTRTVRNR
jgi:hypothetical protein